MTSLYCPAGLARSVMVNAPSRSGNAYFRAFESSSLMTNPQGMAVSTSGWRFATSEMFAECKSIYAIIIHKGWSCQQKSSSYLPGKRRDCSFSATFSHFSSLMPSTRVSEKRLFRHFREMTGISDRKESLFPVPLLCYLSFRIRAITTTPELFTSDEYFGLCINA
jgi:hypothetical protein